MNEIDRRMVENDMLLVELKTISKQTLTGFIYSQNDWSICKNDMFSIVLILKILLSN